VLQFKEVARPTPKDNEVLVQVHAASVNAAELHFLKADPFLMRFMGFGLLKPKHTILGAAMAGRVEAVGRNVTQFQPGDEVFGDLTRCGWGAFAEYVCASEDALALKPANVTFEEAAAVPLGGITALQGLRAKGQIRAGHAVVIYGAGGGVGTFAVQLAKAFGAEVTAVCSTTKVDLARSIGADHVIDYTKEDFTRSEQRYDLIFDNVCNHSRAERSRILTPNGICVLAGIGGAGQHEGQLARIGGNIKAFLASRFSRQKFQMYGTTTKQEDLVVLRDLMAARKSDASYRPDLQVE